MLCTLRIYSIYSLSSRGKELQYTTLYLPNTQVLITHTHTITYSSYIDWYLKQINSSINF